MTDGLLFTILGTMCGVIGLLYNVIRNLRNDFYNELDKMKKLSDDRDNDIKELIREMKADLKEDMREIKNDIRRAESFKCAGQNQR